MFILAEVRVIILSEFCGTHNLHDSHVPSRKHLIRIYELARVKDEGNKGREAKYLLVNHKSTYIHSTQE